MGLRTYFRLTQRLRRRGVSLYAAPADDFAIQLPSKLLDDLTPDNAAAWEERIAKAHAILVGEAKEADAKL